MRSRAIRVAIALAVPAVALVPFAAEGQRAAPAKAQPRAGDGGPTYDPENVTALSQFRESLLKGNERYAAKDFAGAIDIFKKALPMRPRDPLGPYLLGEAHLAMGNLGEAEAAFKQAEELTDTKDPVLRSHVLFAVADCFEREKKWVEARAAWEKYTEHAGKVPDGGAFPGSGTARLKAIDDWLKLDKQYEIVRQRIAAEKDAGADSGAKPAPKK